jgi:hypothetical protein
MVLPHGCCWEFQGDFTYGNVTSSANSEHNNEPEQRFRTFLEIGSLYNVIQPGPQERGHGQLDPACFRLFANPTFKACVLFVNL